MHILICTPAFPPFIGGGERHTGTLAQHLVDSGQAVTVLTSSAAQEPDFWQGCGQDVAIEHARDNLTIIRVPLQPMPGGFRGLLAWRKSMVLLSALPGTLRILQKMAERVPGLIQVDEALAALDKPVDIVHGFNISWEHTLMAGSNYARKMDKPFVASPLAHLGSGAHDRVALNATMRHQRAILSAADLLLTNTALEARGLQQRGIEPARVRVAGPGVDVPDLIAPLPERDETLKPYVIFIGRSSYDKGAMQAVQAVLHLRQQGSDINLILIGRETEAFQSFYNGLSDAERSAVHVLGFVNESLKHAYLSEAEALLLPSRADSFGIVLLESWLYARPVIAARAGGIPDVVNDGQNGLLVPFGDVGALAEAIKRLLDDPILSQKIGENGRQKLLAHYTWESVTAKVLDAYRLVIKSQDSPASVS